MKRESRISKSGRQYFNYYKKKKWRTFKQARELCLIRDGFKCQDCGRSNVALDIHHLVNSHYRLELGARNGESPHNAASNLIALCRSCHLRRHQAHQIKLGRVKEVKMLRSQGLTFQEIGTCLGVSRQRAHQLFYA